MNGTSYLKTLAALGLALLVGSAGCSSDDNKSDEDDNCPSVSGDVSLREDLMPLMRRSCGLSTSCHGNRSNPNAELWLGPKLSDPDPSDADVSEIHAALIADSFTATGVKRVVPGDPGNSFFMQKMENTHTSQGHDCSADGMTDDPCGDSMPPSPSPLLCAGELTTFRNWISQGALDN